MNSKLTNRNLGKVVEFIFVCQASMRGFTVSMPITDTKYDAIIERDCRLYKVQIRKLTRFQRNCFRASVYRIISRQFKGVRKRYSYSPSKKDFDIFAAYLEDESCFYLIPFEEIKTKSGIVVGKANVGRYSIYKNAWHLIG